MESRQKVSHYNNSVLKDFYKSPIVFPCLSPMARSHIIQYSRGQAHHLETAEPNHFPQHSSHHGRSSGSCRLVQSWREVVCCCSSLRRWEAGNPKAEILMDDDKFMWKTEAHPNRAHILQSETTVAKTGTKFFKGTSELLLWHECWQDLVRIL